MKTILQSTILNWTRSRPMRTLLASAVILTISATLNCPSAMAQKFDLEAYLKKIDANRNGRMDEAELGGRMKSYVVKLGLDPKKSPSIKKILSVSTKYESKKSESSSKKSESKVPGFGSTVDDADRTPVGSFGKVEEKKSSGSSTSATKQSFSKSSMERAEKTLSRYDKNKNGSLDRDEIKGAPWGSPSPSQSDLNKDGRLSKSELAQRYQSREQYYRGSSSRSSSSRSSSRSRSSSSSSSKRLAEDRARREKERSKYKSSYSKTSSPSSSSRTSSRSSSESKKSDTAVSRAKYEKYVKGLIKGYDTDKDGKLSKDELSKMRRPPTGADADKDGFVTQSELLDSLSGTKKSSSTSSAKADSKTDSKSTAKRSKSSTYERKSSRSGSRYSRSSSSSFESMDQSGDKQVQMHEFSDKWDDEKVAEFYKIDKNGDGVITSKEWSQRER